MGKTYKVVFNSAIALGSPTSSNDTQFFFYDWSRIPEGRYKCSFTYINQIQQRILLFTTAMVFMDLGQNHVFFADRSAVRSGAGIPFGAEYYNSTFIGCLESQNTRTGASPIQNATNGGYLATRDTNPPFYLDKRPNNNNINIRVVEGTASLTNGQLFGYNMGNYTLTLYLEHLD
jgi:hypothetical protein